MAGYTYRGTTFDAGGRAQGRKPIEHGTTVSQHRRCAKRDLGACDPCKKVAAAYEARRRIRNDPRYALLHALQALAELGDAA